MGSLGRKVGQQLAGSLSTTDISFLQLSWLLPACLQPNIGQWAVHGRAGGGGRSAEKPSIHEESNQGFC